MKTKDEIIIILAKEKENLKKYDILRAGLFGSYLKGNATTESDIDILLDISENSNLTLFSLISLELHLSEKMGAPVDFAIKRDLKKSIGEHILNEVQFV